MSQEGASGVATVAVGTSRESGRHLAGIGLVTLLSGAFLSVMSGIIVSIAIPSIQAEFGATPTVSSIIAYYGLAYGLALVTGGRLGDLFGRRRVFVAGMAGFTAASLACALASSLTMIILARVAAGLSAALLFPQVLSIIRVSSGDDAARARNLSAFGITLGLSGTLAQLLGGLLITANIHGLAWRWVFILCLPIGLVACLLGPRVIPESRAPGRPQLDFAGVALCAVAFALVLFPLVEGRALGWPAWLLALPLLAIPAFWLFARHQLARARRGVEPLIDLALFSRGPVASGVTVAFFLHSTIVSMPFIQAMFLQVGLGYPALGAALIIAPAGLAFIGASMACDRLAARHGARAVMAAGAVFAITGYLACIAIARTAPPDAAWRLTFGLAVVSGGQGLFMPLMLNAVLAHVPPEKAGSASGVISTAQQVGGAFGVALAGLLYFSALLRHGDEPGGPADAFSHATAWPAVAMTVCLLLLPALFPRRCP
ncbi:MFS transporter [Camelimonas abortus]|uniref:MFS transporter n=1 Tax=Camelimonas abortus TaxID=1017184 RepID=A0ABV7LBI6_9HYPH